MEHYAKVVLPLAVKSEIRNSKFEIFLVSAPRTDDRVGLASEFRSPSFCRFVAFLVTRRAEDARDESIRLFPIKKSLEATGQQSPSRLADSGVTYTLRRCCAPATAHHNRVLSLLPLVEFGLFLTGARVTEGRAQVADVVNRLARLARSRTVRVLLRIEASKLLVVSLGITVVDEGEPKFECINLGRRRRLQLPQGFS